MIKSLLPLLLLLSSSFTTPFNASNNLVESEYQKVHIQLKEKYGTNKSFVNDLEFAALVTLSYYPELKDTKIKFKLKNTKTTMATRPGFQSFFTKKNNRTYIVYVDKEVKGNNGLLVVDVPFNAKVGLIAHEFEHILKYEQMNLMQIAKLGIHYANQDFKTTFERDTDRRVVERGLGWQLRDWAEYSMERCNASHHYKMYKKNVYLDQAQIVNAMSEIKLYDRFFEDDEDILVTK